VASPHDEEPRRGLLRGGHLAWFALAAAMVPLVVSAVALVVDVGADYYPWGDQALIELQTRDVGHHPVLLGLYSREGWNHPGPVLFYLLALPYRLSGGASIGLNLGALLINGSAIVGMALVAKRRGGTPLLLLTLAGCALLVRALGPDFMRDPWVPSIPVLPFGLLVFLTWAMACGETWALPVAAGVATFCVQTHVGYLPLALVLLAWGAAWLVMRARRGARDRLNGEPVTTRDVVRAGVISAAVLVVAWLPPLIEQQVQSPGNVRKVAEYFREPDTNDGVHTVGDGYAIVSGQFGLSSDWLTGARAPSPFTGEPDVLRSPPTPVLLIPFAFAAFLLWRRRSWDACRLIGTLALALCVGVVSVMRIIGPVFAYRVRWTWVLAMEAMVVVAWTAWMLLSSRAPRAEPRWPVPVLVSALLTLTAVNTVSAARAGTPQERESAALGELLPSVAASLPDGDGDAIVRPDGLVGGLYGSGLVLGLERRGIAARGDHPRSEEILGEHRVHRRGPVRAVLTVTGNEGIEKLSARPDLRLVAYTGTLSRRERARITERADALDAAHEAGTISDVRYLLERSELGMQLGFAVAVFTERPMSAG
jgi:hypothetical protein